MFALFILFRLAIVLSRKFCTVKINTVDEIASCMVSCPTKKWLVVTFKDDALLWEAINLKTNYCKVYFSCNFVFMNNCVSFVSPFVFVLCKLCHRILRDLNNSYVEIQFSLKFIKIRVGISLPFLA